MHHTVGHFWQAYTGLKTLYLECNAIADIEGLEHLRDLRCLYIGRNMIHEIAGLDNLHQLESLDLSDNGVRCVENLDHLMQLKVLNLSGEQASSGHQHYSHVRCGILLTLTYTHHCLASLQHLIGISSPQPAANLLAELHHVCSLSTTLLQYCCTLSITWSTSLQVTSCRALLT